MSDRMFDGRHRNSFRMVKTRQYEKFLVRTFTRKKLMNRHLREEKFPRQLTQQYIFHLPEKTEPCQY